MKTLNNGEIGVRAALAPKFRTRPSQKSELRKEDRRRTSERVEKSAILAVRYPELKTLVLNLVYFGRGIASWGYGVRYWTNLVTAKSALYFRCPDSLCKDGGFDLSANLSSAVAQHQRSVVGAMRCPGYRDQTSKRVPCESILHFKINLAFNQPSPVATRRFANSA